jgi:hypothetical protein
MANALIKVSAMEETHEAARLESGTDSKRRRSVSISGSAESPRRGLGSVQF